MNNYFLDAHATQLVAIVMTRLAENKPLDSQWIKENDLTIDQVEAAFRITSIILAQWINSEYKQRFQILSEGSESRTKMMEQ